MYDAVMDRITRWVPELKDHFERAAAGEKVKHKPVASLEERAAADKQQRQEQWASAKASRRSTSAPSSFVCKRKCQDEALVRTTKRACYGSKYCRGCEIDGVHVECSFSTRVPGGKVRVCGGTVRTPYPNCLLCTETSLQTLETLEKRGRFAEIGRSLKACCAWRKEHPAVYDAAMDRITRCLLCSETRLKTLENVETLETRGRFAQIARSLETFHAWRAEHPAVYDAVMDRITRWVPELKDRFERVAAKLEERAAADKQQREEQRASAKASWRRTSPPTKASSAKVQSREKCSVSSAFARFRS